ncbi:MAG: hypothetical protein P8100_07135 [bacterium]
MAGSFIMINFIGPDKKRTRIIDGDGSGLYAYLPTVLIHRTVDFTPVFNEEKSRRALDYQGHYFYKHQDILINKYTSGTAIMETPLFLAAWLLSPVFGLPQDGYNVLFQYSVALSAILFVFLGLLSLARLMSFYSVKRWLVYLMLLFLLFGTNLFYYTFMAPAMSHAYSFGLISIFLYLMKSLFLHYRKVNLYLAAFVFGLIILVRPVNGIVLFFIPFLAGSFHNLFSLLKRKVLRFDLLPAAFLFLLALLPQLIMNYLQTGNPVVIGYRNEGFYLYEPKILPYLFSYRKGWWIYSPFMLLIIPAVAWLYKRSSFAFWSAIIPLFVLIYLFSSWWNWFYGDSFGMRPMIDYYSIFILFIALMFNIRANLGAAAFLGIFGSLAVVLNLFQTYQYARGILHPDSMNREAYWHVFLKTGEKYEGAIGDHDEYFYGDLNKEPFFTTETGFSHPAAGWKINEAAVRETPEGNVLHLDDKVVYGPTFDYYFNSEQIGMNNIYVIFGIDYREMVMNAGMGSLFVVSITDGEDELLFYKTFRLKPLPSDDTGNWHTGSIGFKLPEITGNMVRARIYIWNKGGLPIDLRNPFIRFHTYQPRAHRFTIFAGKAVELCLLQKISINHLAHWRS